MRSSVVNSTVVAVIVLLASLIGLAFGNFLGISVMLGGGLLFILGGNIVALCSQPAHTKENTPETPKPEE